ncbi:MAG: hypothetical protein KDA28_11725, partial [Phycisphaerales bacterium]|nr:hypothetical protein [Phycisphaerales bacterium]
EDGSTAVPLERSVETLAGLTAIDVELTFRGELEPWARKGERELALPSYNAPVARLEWELRLPPTFHGEREIFTNKRQCTRCHEGDVGIDQKSHDVGTRGEFDPPDEEYYTPKLVELWRTAPFLHDDRAATLRDVFTVHDAAGKHGKASLLTPAELDDLVEYLRSR